jgi:Domain of unknown function (DUF4214)
MRILTAFATALALNIAGAAVVSAQYYPPSERSWRDYGMSNWRAERIVRQAYREILGRDPDPSGLQQYTNAMLYRDWSETDVRNSLMSSSEYRELNSVRGDGRAAAIVRRAYLDVLGREPDPSGMREYSSRVMWDGWSEADVRRALRASAEYRGRY